MSYILLAVDFPCLYPRIHCKTDEYGISLMDIGAAGVIITTAFSNKKIKESFMENQKYSMIKELMKNFKNSIIIILIGSIRLIVHKLIGYWEHPTEYGLHWNFYMTISVTNLATSFIKDAKYALGIALILITCYEVLLTSTDLKQFIFYAERENFFSANREGICSSMGYVSMFLIGIGIGRIHYKDLYILDKCSKEKESDKETEE